MDTFNALPVLGNKLLLALLLQLGILWLMVDQFSPVAATYIPNLHVKDAEVNDNLEKPVSSDLFSVDGSRIPGFKTQWNEYLHMNAGILPADQITDVNQDNLGLFFWDFHMIGNASHISERPLVIWLNGGPGCSSMDGALMEVGPLRVNEKAEVEWSKGWFEKVDLLFIDQPVGTGFSPNAKAGYDENLEQSSQHLINFLENYFNKFPDFEIKYSKIIVAGESYAGQYIPYFARALKDHSRFSSKLSTIMLGNAWLDPNLQSLAYVPYALDNEIIQTNTDLDERRLSNLLRAQDQCQNIQNGPDLTKVPFEDPTCESILTKLLQSYKPAKNQCINVYDIKKVDSYPACGLNWPEILPQTTSLLNLESVQAALHVSGANPWKECNAEVHRNFKPTNQLNGAKLLPGLLNDGVKVNLFSGIDDMICNYLGTEMVMKEYTNTYLENNNYSFDSNTRLFGLHKREVQKLQMDSQWYHDDIRAGSFWQRGNLTYVKVENASHMVPYDSSISSIGLLELALRDDDSKHNGDSADSEIKTYTAEPQAPEQEENPPSSTPESDVPNESNPDASLTYNSKKIIAMLIMFILLLVIIVYVYKLIFSKPRRYSALARSGQGKPSAYTRYAYEWISRSPGSSGKKKRVHWIDEEEENESSTEDLELGDMQETRMREGSLEDEEEEELEREQTREQTEEQENNDVENTTKTEV